MIMKRLSITIGIILALAFFVSLIAALSSDEEEVRSQSNAATKEINCASRHAGDHAREGHKPCCDPEKCKEMKCDTSMCKSMREKCAMAGKKCNPSECPHHSGKCLKGENKPEEACTKHTDNSTVANKKCDPKTCSGKCPSKKEAGK
jgi:hypothetical protein